MESLNISYFDTTKAEETKYKIFVLYVMLTVTMVQKHRPTLVMLNFLFFTYILFNYCFLMEKFMITGKQILLKQLTISNKNNLIT